MSNIGNNKSAPAPIFNYQKRQRQTAPTQTATQQSAANIQQAKLGNDVTAPVQHNSFSGHCSRGASLLAPLDRASRMYTRSAARGRGNSVTQEQNALISPLNNRPFSAGNNRTSMPEGTRSAAGRSSTQAAPTLPGCARGGRLNQGQRAWGQRVQGKAHVGPAAPAPCQQSEASSPLPGPSWQVLPAVGMEFATSVDKRPNTTETLGISQSKSKLTDAEDITMRALTIPISHLRRVLALRAGCLPPLLFIIFGIVDSETTEDTATAGKQFLLRDESGSISCVFCEIDRPMPKLHRGQWYRVVGIVKTAWDRLQCLTVRPASLEERQNLRILMSRCTAYVNRLCQAMIEV